MIINLKKTWDKGFYKGPLLGQKLLKVDNYFGGKVILRTLQGSPLVSLSYEPKFK